MPKEPAPPLAAGGDAPPTAPPSESGAESVSEAPSEPAWRRAATSKEGASSPVQPRVGFTCNADGSRMPLGPRIEVSGGE